MSRGTEGKGELARSDSLSKPLRHAAARAFLVADQGSGNVPTRKMSLTLWLCFCKIIAVLFFPEIFWSGGKLRSFGNGGSVMLVSSFGVFMSIIDRWRAVRSGNGQLVRSAKQVRLIIKTWIYM
jgi:hypothetical protein